MLSNGPLNILTQSNGPLINAMLSISTSPSVTNLLCLLLFQVCFYQFITAPSELEIKRAHKFYLMLCFIIDANYFGPNQLLI